MWKLNENGCDKLSRLMVGIVPEEMEHGMFSKGLASLEDENKEIT